MDTIIQILAAFICSYGFSIVFVTKKNYRLLVAADGMLSWTLYLFCCLFLSSFFANLITAAFCSLYAHIASRIVKAPTTCLLMPAVIPMVPGGSLFYTMSYALSGDMEQFLEYGMSTCRTIFAMAIGFAIITLFFRTMEKNHRDTVHNLTQ